MRNSHHEPRRLSKNPRPQSSSYHRSSYSSSHIPESEPLARPSNGTMQNAAERPNRKKRKSPGILTRLGRGWTIEIISWIVSAGALAALVIVLNKYDQKPVPSWPLGITLNTLLAFLTAISQAGFVNPVISGLSQMKWNWFSSRDKSLADFEKIDDASRGTWGSILLVFSAKGRLSVLIATVILLSSTVTSTITQAALTQVTRYVPTNGTATITSLLNDSKLNEGSGVLTAMYGSLLSAALTSVNTTYGSTEPTCSSGNCEFPSFGSLAVCVDLHDISDTLISECVDAVTSNGEDCDNATIANIAQNKQFYLQANDASEPLINSTNIAVGSLVYEDDVPDHSNVAFLDFWSEIESFSNDSFGVNGVTVAQIIYLNTTGMSMNWFNSKPDDPPGDYLSYVRAVEAMFYMCVETYNVTTTNGTTQTAITATAGNVTDYAYPNVTYTVDNTNYTFRVTPGLPGQVSAVLEFIITGAFSEDATDFGGSDGMTAFSYALGQALYPNYTAGTQSANYTGIDDQAMFHTLELLLGNMARESTDWLRTKYGTSLQGQNYAPSAYVVVRWPFIACLGAQVVLSLIFLAWIIVDTWRRKVGVVKDSTLSTLFALPEKDRSILQNQMHSAALVGDYDGMNNLDIIEDVGDSTRVYLDKGEFGILNLQLAR